MSELRIRTVFWVSSLLFVLSAAWLENNSSRQWIVEVIAGATLIVSVTAGVIDLVTRKREIRLNRNHESDSRD